MCIRDSPFRTLSVVRKHQVCNAQKSTYTLLNWRLDEQCTGAMSAGKRLKQLSRTRVTNQSTVCLLWISRSSTAPSTRLSRSTHRSLPESRFFAHNVAITEHEGPLYLPRQKDGLCWIHVKLARQANRSVAWDLLWSRQISSTS